MATAVPAGASSRGGTSTCRSGHLLPPPSTGEPTATSRVSRGSSSRRSEASEGAARGTDDAEGMGKKMVPAADDMGGRGGCYRGLSSSSYGSRAAPLTRDHPASPPVSSRRGGNGRKTRGGSDASSFVRPRPNDEQERLSTRAIFLQQPSVPRNIRPQAARHASLPDRRVEVGNRVPPRFFHKHRGHVRAIDATNEEISPRVSEKENDVDGQKYWQTDSVPSRILSARDWNSESDGAFEGSNHIADFKNPCALPRNIKVQAQRLPSVLRRVEEAGLLPPRFIHCGPGRLMCRARSSYNYSQFVGAIDPTNGKFPKATEMENEVDEQDCQTAIVASLSPSAQDLDAESYGVFEATKPDSELKKPSATPRNIRMQRHGQPSVLGRSVEGGNQVPKRLIARSRPDKLIRQACFSHNYSPRVGAIDDIHEQRVPKGCSKHYSSVTTSNKFDGVPLRKCLTTSAKGIQIAGATKKVVYATTLGGGGGYGDPHPPPFYKCEVCCKRTAFSRLKCCHLVVCDHCGCDCDTEYVEDKKLQFQKDGQQSDKEKLPKVKFEGTDLFLWQPFSYPADLMLCMAKRAGCQLEYYFAPVHELMDSRLTVINTTVYRFHQFGRKTRSLKVTEELISRKQLH